MDEYLKIYGENAKAAARILSSANSGIKNKALLNAAKLLVEKNKDILQANKIDVEKAQQNGMSKSMLDRLSLNEARIESMADGLRQLTTLNDPIGEIVEGWTRPNGIEIIKKRVPLGVISIIFESRPNVTADAAGLCLKSGNACILRGGSEAINSNIAIAKIISEAIEEEGLPGTCVQLIDNTSREISKALMNLNKYVDVLIPRGGASLIKAVVENSTIPVIETGTGNCHIFVDSDADLEMALEIIINAKVQRPSVCNAVETVLIDKRIASEFTPKMVEELKTRKVDIRGCKKCKEICADINEANETDWETEYNDLIVAVKIVDGIDEAIAHIAKYGTLHSEAIITKDYNKAMKFQKEVDAACVYVNVSTRFTDGSEFGMGAEIGISNQKLHARGPMGLKELTTIKYCINGNGQIRK